MIEEVDVSYGEAQEHREMDINDEKVKDRWSRYIGAMGVEAVAKQSKASIVLLGLGSLGIEIAKNIVLSGCREISIWDDKLTTYSDLSGQFFLGEQDVGKSRLEATFHKLQELNNYVKMTKLQYNPSELNSLKGFQVLIATERPHEEQLELNKYCRANGIHFLSVDCYGPYGQIFNDFGSDFEVVDKDGEETVEVLIEDISIEEKGIVKVVKGQRHPYSDGDTIRIQSVKGMRLLENE